MLTERLQEVKMPILILLRYGAYALLACALCSVAFYYRGKAAARDEIEQAQTGEALQLAVKQAKKTAPILIAREDKQREVKQSNPGVAAVVAAGCVRDKPNRPKLPDAPATTELHPARRADREIPAYDCTKDVEDYRALIVDYRTLRLWALGNGADKP